MFLELTKNTPEIYSESSRDFQLLCRILDIYINRAIEKSSKINSNLNIDSLDESLLPLMARRLGFSSPLYFPPNTLRNICEVFPYIIRNKGTKQAIFKAAYAVLSSNQTTNILNISYKNKENQYIDNADVEDKQLYLVEIFSNASKDENNQLKEVLSFILPAGIGFNYISLIKQVKESVTNTQLGPGELLRIRGKGAAISTVLGNIAGQTLISNDADINQVDWGSPISTSSPSMRYSRVNIAMIKRNQWDETISNVVKDIKTEAGE